jgi:serine/threonine protein kinase/DNA polymerase III delta prime subunit
MGEDKKLTMQSIAERKEAKRLTFADSRYITRGNPRSGGLASVYRAIDMESEQPVALKVFRTGDGTDEVIEESFRREVQALSELRHPNIVRIIASGRDEENAAHYIVMEWVETDLRAFAEKRRFEGWADYYATVGKGVLDALVFAHSRSTVHRDIKPTNVLVTEEGQVKLCDFGISKIRNFLTPGVTLAQFASAPYAPPEPDDGSYSYSRDVFAFAALSTVLLTGEQLSSHADLLNGLEKLDIDEAVRKILRRCLSLEVPAARPTNAIVLLAELEGAAPAAAAEAKPVVLLSVTQRVKGIVEHDMALRGPQAEKFVERDLEGARCEELPPQPNREGRSVRLIGSKYRYTAVRDQSGQRLSIVDAVELPPSEIEKQRLFCCDPPVRFGLSGAMGSQSASNIDAFLERLAVFASDQKLRKLEQREQALYKTWLDLLSAKTELEKMRKVRLEYDGLDAKGEFLRLKLRQGNAGGPALVEQDISIDTGVAGEFKGTVVSVDSGVLLVRPSERNRTRSELIPTQGWVETDTTKSDVALDKQKTAVEAVRFGRSVNPDLGRFIVNPEQVEVPPSVEVEFIQQNIDEDKKEAVLAALAGPPLMLVEGPPGTGKTTFITELVLQTLRAQPNARVLLTSQTHVALDNSLERIVKQSSGSVSAVRIGQEGDDRIADSTRKLLLDAKLPELRKKALASGRAFIEQWAVERGLNPKDIRRAMALEGHATLKTRLEAVDTELRLLEPQMGDDHRKKLDAEARSELDDKFQGLVRERDDLEKALRESFKELSNHVESKEELKEFAECSAADLRGWAEAYSDSTSSGAQLKALMEAHADWEARFGRSREFQAAVIASSQVVAGTCLGVMSVPGRNEIIYDLCIVDEASIATPTEALVPMSRSRRTVLVGDSRQLSPFQDPELRDKGLLERFGLRPEDQKATLFNHLRETLPSELHKTLTTQHRMLPAIGDLVSECFYDAALKSVERKADAQLVGALPKPVTWYSTSKRANKASRKIGTSYVNDLEVEFIVTLLGRVDFTLQKGKAKGRQISVAVLTGYGEQRAKLQMAIQTKRHAWTSYSDIYVNVVDAFQGREADMVLFSVTRSEVQGLGFLRELERINVALSRGKELLAIVGDHYYCQTVAGAVNPLKEVIDYIRRHPDACALEELAQ